MKLKVKNKDCWLKIKLKLASGEEADEIGIKNFAALNLRGFLRPTWVKKSVIEYSGPVGVSLIEHLKNPITKHEFYYIIEQVLIAVMKVHNHRLLMNQLLLDPAYTFINASTKELQFIYVPLKTVMESRGIVAYLDAISSQVIPAHEVDKNYASRFSNYLNNQRGFDPFVIEQFIAKEDLNVIQTIRRLNAGQSGFITNKRKQQLEHVSAKNATAQSSKAAPRTAQGTVFASVAHTSSPVGGAVINRSPRTSSDDELLTGLLDESPVGSLNDYLSGGYPENSTAVSKADFDSTGLLDESPVTPANQYFSGGYPENSTVVPKTDFDSTGLLDESPVTPANQYSSGGYPENSTAVPKVNYNPSGFADKSPAFPANHHSPGGNYRDNSVASGADSAPTGLLDDGSVSHFSRRTPTYGDDSSENETTLLVGSEAEKYYVRYPRLTRIRTGETIQVDKPVFRLGKEKSYVDYFVSNNSAVSRSHADIITRGQKCFVTDLNSKNRTFINDRPIPVHCEVEIRNGDRLRLGNEEFMFYF